MSVFNNERIQLGELTTPLPDHLTLLNGFVIPDKSKQKFIADVEKVASNHSIFTVYPAGVAQFGEFDVVKVNELSGVLGSLHYKLCDTVERNRGVIMNPYHRGKFSAHVTGWAKPAPAAVHEFFLVNHRGGFGVDVTVDAIFQLPEVRFV